MSCLEVLKTIETPNFDKFSQTPSYEEMSSLLDKYDFKNVFSEIEKSALSRSNLLETIKQAIVGFSSNSISISSILHKDVIRYLMSYKNSYLKIVSMLGENFSKPHFSFLQEMYRQDIKELHQYLKNVLNVWGDSNSSTSLKTPMSDSEKKKVRDLFEPLESMLCSNTENSISSEVASQNARIVASMSILLENLILLKHNTVYVASSKGSFDKHLVSLEEKFANFVDYTLNALDRRVISNDNESSLTLVGVMREMKTELEMLIQSKSTEVV